MFTRYGYGWLFEHTSWYQHRASSDFLSEDRNDAPYHVPVMGIVWVIAISLVLWLGVGAAVMLTRHSPAWLRSINVASNHWGGVQGKVTDGTADSSLIVQHHERATVLAKLPSEQLGGRCGYRRQLPTADPGGLPSLQRDKKLLPPIIAIRTQCAASPISRYS